MYLFLVAVRKVTVGHEIVVDGHTTVAQDWKMFEEVVEEVLPGDLPQCLWQLKGRTTPTKPPAPPSPMEVGQQGEAVPLPAPSPSPVKREQGAMANKTPVIVMVGGIRQWTFPQCSTVWGSHNSCDAHIRQTHTGKAFVCAFCSFSSYNLDSMQRHEKEQK